MPSNNPSRPGSSPSSRPSSSHSSGSRSAGQHVEDLRSTISGSQGLNPLLKGPVTTLPILTLPESRDSVPSAHTNTGVARPSSSGTNKSDTTHQLGSDDSSPRSTGATSNHICGPDQHGNICYYGYLEKGGLPAFHRPKYMKTETDNGTSHVKVVLPHFVGQIDAEYWKKKAREYMNEEALHQAICNPDLTNFQLWREASVVAATQHVIYPPVFKALGHAVNKIRAKYQKDMLLSSGTKFLAQHEVTVKDTRSDDSFYIVDRDYNPLEPDQKHEQFCVLEYKRAGRVNPVQWRGLVLSEEQRKNRDARGNLKPMMSLFHRKDATSKVARQICAYLGRGLEENALKKQIAVHGHEIGMIWDFKTLIIIFADIHIKSVENVPTYEVKLSITVEEDPIQVPLLMLGCLTEGYRMKISDKPDSVLTNSLAALYQVTPTAQRYEDRENAKKAGTTH